MSVDAGFTFELDKAIADNELVLHYQPIVRVSDRKPIAVEALVRWRHRTRGILPPSQFVPAIERAGLARELSLWVLREAIMQSSVWKTDRQSLSVSLNLSPENLGDAQFHRTLEMMMRAFGTQELLIVEITGGEIAALQQHQRPQVRRDDRDDVHDHPLGLVFRAADGFDHLKTLGEILDLLLAVGLVDIGANSGGFGVEIEEAEQLLDRLSAHFGFELVAVFLIGGSIFIFGENLLLFQGR